MPTQMVGYTTNVAKLNWLGTTLSWIQALPLGRYDHPLYGEITVTPDKVARMVQNFNDRVREIDLDIDYDHKEFTSKAAGWVRQVDDRGTDGLWLLVEWTNEAADAIRNDEYRYFSAEFADEWQHPKSGVVYKDVLFGGGITNRPFVKDIMPLNLSEILLGRETQGEGDKVEEFLVKLATLLGLSEEDGKSEEKVIKALGDLIAKANTPPPKTDPSPPTPDQELAQLAEKNPTIAKMLKESEENRQRLVALELANRTGVMSSKLAEIKSAKWTLPVSFTDALKGMAIKLSDEDSGALIKALGTLVESGLVPVGEIGGRDPQGNGGGKSTAERLNEAVKALMDADKNLNYGDAVSQAFREDPDLWNDYDAQQVSLREVEG